MTFRGFCQRDHDRIDFDGKPDEFTAHMTGEMHRVRPMTPPPPAWKVPNRSPGMLDKWIESGDLIIEAAEDVAA